MEGVGGCFIAVLAVAREPQETGVLELESARQAGGGGMSKEAGELER